MKHSDYPIYSPPNYTDSKFAGEVQQPYQIPQPVYVHPVQVSPMNSVYNDCKDKVDVKDSYSTLKGIFAGISTFTILEVIRTIFF